MSSPLRVEKNVEAPAPEPAPQPKKGGARRIFVLGILVLMVIVGGIFGFRTYLFYEHHATTDDAQIDGHIDPVPPRVSGYVSQVLVSDNQPVKAGDVLVRIDPADLQAKVDQEQASLLNAEAAVSVAQAALAGTRANLAGTRAKALAHSRRRCSASGSIGLVAGVHLMNQSPASKVMPPSSFFQTARSGRAPATARTPAGTTIPAGGPARMGTG